MAKEKPGVMMYWEMFDVLENLLDGQAKTMLHAIRCYSQYDTDPDFAGDTLLATLWMLVKPKIDADSQRYERIIEQKRQAGKASAAKRLSKSNECQQPLTDADGCHQIQPTTTATATATSETTASTATAIRDKGKREMDKGLTSQPENESSHESSCSSDVEYVDFEQRRKDFIEKLRQPV